MGQAKETNPLLGDGATSATGPDYQPPSPTHGSSDVDFGFKHGPRDTQNLLYKVVWAACVLVTAAGGFYGVSHRHRKFGDMTASFLVDPANCPAGGAPSGRRLLAEGEEDSFNVSAFMSHSTWYFVVSAVGSALLGVLLLKLFANHARGMVKMVVCVQVAVPLVVGIVATLHQGAAGLIPLGMAALSAFCFYLWKDQLELCASLLAVSSAGLRENPGVLPAILLVKGLMVIFVVPMAAFSAVAYMNGDVTPNANVVSTVGKACKAADGQPVPCCAWDLDNWVPAYLTLAGLTLAWTVRLAFEIRIFTVAGTISQWYFAPVGSTSFKGTTMRSLGHALGPQLGTLCFGALILTMVDMARAAARKRSRESQSLIACLFALLVSCISAMIEYITKFASVRAAVTGEDFCLAARGAYDVLRRNFMDAYGVWWVPQMVLSMTAFILALTWALAAGFMSYASFLARPDVFEQPVPCAVILGAVSFVLSMVVLCFFATVLLNIVDAVFYCYAVDRDRQMVSKPEVHDVYKQLPSCNKAQQGLVVEQPDGDMGYAPPVENQAPTEAPSAPLLPSRT